MLTIKFVTDTGGPAGKLADAEVHFGAGLLAGLKLVGFAVWERRNGGRNVTMPARTYAVNGERRSYALLRPVADSLAQEPIRRAILAAYADAYDGPAGQPVAPAPVDVDPAPDRLTVSYGSTVIGTVPGPVVAPAPAPVAGLAATVDPF